MPGFDWPRTLMQPVTDTVDLLRRIADRTITAPQDSAHADLMINFDAWQWHQGVALYGLIRA